MYENLKNTDERLNYIWSLSNKEFPICDYGDDGEVYQDLSGMPIRFISRLKNSDKYRKLAKLNARHDEFLKNNEIQDFIKMFNLDVEEFWFLILFIYDFSCNQCNNGYKKESPKEKLYKALSGKVDSITIKSGKNKIVIDDSVIIENICETIIEDMDNTNIDKWSRFSIETFLNNSTYESNSVLAYAVYYYFNSFFAQTPSITSKRKNKENPSIKEKYFIVNLIYFTRIIDNEDFTSSLDYLKVLIKRYKDHTLPDGEFTY